MQLLNSTSMITDGDFELLSIQDIIGDVQSLPDISNGTLIYTDLYVARIKKSINGKLYLPKNFDVRDMEGTLIWALPIQKVFEHQTKSDLVQLSSLEIENKRLHERVAKLEAQAYTLQTEKNMLQLHILEKCQEIQEATLKLAERVKAMDVYKNRPIASLLVAALIFLVLGFVFLVQNMLSIGATFSFISFSLTFFFLYALWRLTDIVIIRPRLMIVGLCGSLGLLVTAICSFFI